MSRTPGSNAEAIIARKLRVEKLAFEGRSIFEIARELGCGSATVKRDLKDIARKNLKRMTAMNADLFAAKALADHEEMMRRLADEFSNGDENVRIACMRLMQRQMFQTFTIFQRMGYLPTATQEHRVLHSFASQVQLMDEAEAVRIGSLPDEEFDREVKKLIAGDLDVQDIDYVIVE